MEPYNVKVITYPDLSRQCDSSFGRKRYWSSRNLLTPLEEVFHMDGTARFVLSDELGECSKFKKISTVQYGEMTQSVEIFDL
ncbi:hypothetical protein [Lacrimispora xylanisolvens]|uniref:hypothetical protein n=1 Tax=Lacrimispora xylanisolvens TaxID=384636 RepID=UPI002402CCCC